MRILEHGVRTNIFVLNPGNSFGWRHAIEISCRACEGKHAVESDWKTRTDMAIRRTGGEVPARGRWAPLFRRLQKRCASPGDGRTAPAMQHAARCTIGAASCFLTAYRPDDAHAALPQPRSRLQRRHARHLDEFFGNIERPSLRAMMPFNAACNVMPPEVRQPECLLQA